MSIIINMLRLREMKHGYFWEDWGEGANWLGIDVAVDVGHKEEEGGSLEEAHLT